MTDYAKVTITLFENILVSQPHAFIISITNEAKGCLKLFRWLGVRRVDGMGKLVKLGILLRNDFLDF